MTHAKESLAHMTDEPELGKLDAIDVKVAQWVHEKHPKALYSFIEYLAFEYRKKAVELDVNRMYLELCCTFNKVFTPILAESA